MRIFTIREETQRGDAISHLYGHFCETFAIEMIIRVNIWDTRPPVLYPNFRLEAFLYDCGTDIFEAVFQGITLFSPLLDTMLVSS